MSAGFATTNSPGSFRCMVENEVSVVVIFEVAGQLLAFNSDRENVGACCDTFAKVKHADRNTVRFDFISEGLDGILAESVLCVVLELVELKNNVALSVSILAAGPCGRNRDSAERSGGSELDTYPLAVCLQPDSVGQVGLRNDDVVLVGGGSAFADLESEVCLKGLL